MVCACASRADVAVLADHGEGQRVAIYVDDHALDAPNYDDVDWYDAEFVGDRACTEAFLAEELRHYLAKLGATDPSTIQRFSLAELAVSDGPPVRLVVGHAALLPGIVDPAWFQGPESYAIHAVQRSGVTTIILSGYDTAGTVYAVYEFLERLGCRWYAQGTDGEVIPQKDRLEYPVTAYQGKPFLRKRGGTALASSPDMLLWAARNKLNATFYTDLRRFPMAKMLGFIDFEGGHLSWKMLNPDDAYPYTLANNPYAFVTDPSTNTTGGEDRDTDGTLTYYEAHPEWFGYDATRGVRDVWHPDEPRGLTVLRNFCISNETGRNVWIQRALEDIRNRPYLDTIYIDLNDTPRFCECAECVRRTPSDWNLLLMCELARAVDQTGLKTKIGINFYTYTRTDVPPSEPVNLTEAEYARLEASYAPIRRCYAHAIDDVDCYEPLSPAECNRATATFFVGWHDAGFRDKYMIVDYLNRGPWCWTPALVADRIVEDYRIYDEKLNVIKGWMAFGIRPPFGAKLWDYYVFAKLCDKGMAAHAAYPALKKAFFSEYFGEFQGDAVAAAFEAARAAFENISYFHNRPHAVFEGILAQSRPDMLRESAIDGTTGPWRMPLESVEDLFPFAHLGYATQPNTGANSVDVQEMRPLLADLKTRVEMVQLGDANDVYARRWQEVRAQLIHGYWLAQLLIALVDTAKADIEKDVDASATALTGIGECLDVLKSDVVQPFGTMNEGPWLIALHETLRQHPDTLDALAAKYPELRESPRVPGPPPAPPRPKP